MASCKMFGGRLFKPKFYKKCKAAIKLTKTRLETIKRKREAVLKFLKNDIADLLKNDLDYNAYGRVEGLFIEQNITRCYKLIEEFCECILDNLSNMPKQSECPEECREAVASLAFAAARFADLPELRNLRSLFYDKYGTSIDIFINKEFSSRVRPGHPTKETKLQLMRDVALEFSIEWDSKTLEQKLFTPLLLPTSQKSVQSTDEARENEEKRDMQARLTWRTDEKQVPDDTLLKTENKFGVGRKHNPNGTLKFFRHDPSSSGSSSSQDTIDIDDQIIQIPTPPRENLENKKTPSFREETTLSKEEDVENKKLPNLYKNIPPPYRKEPKIEPSSKPKPRSVRQRRPGPVQEPDSPSGAVDGEEKVLDGLLRHYSSKKSPYEVEEPASSSWWWMWKGSKASDAGPPKKAVSLEQKKTTVEDDDQIMGHRRASSLGQSEVSGGGRVHVHPKLPEYEELPARIAELRRSGET